jgi:hypothetical protein
MPRITSPFTRRAALAASALAAAALALPATVLAQGKDIKIAHVYSKTGPLEAYGKHRHRLHDGLTTPPAAR